MVFVHDHSIDEVDFTFIFLINPYCIFMDGVGTDAVNTGKQETR